jgi:hypothetical protein
MENSSTRYWLNLIIRVLAIGIILALIFGYLPAQKVYAQDPTLSINDVSLIEGDSGTSSMIFIVTLSEATDLEVTVSYTTADGTAISPSDYTSQTGTVTFPPLSVSQTFSVPIVGDTVSEMTETFSVHLSSPTNATIFKSDGIGTIYDNDLPTLSINDTSITEGDSGTLPMGFTVTLSGPTSQVVTVAYATVNGTATAGSDYTAKSGTLTFNPGVTTQPISVDIVGDLVSEPTENFIVRLSSPTHATIFKSDGIGTILDNDLPTLSINDTSITEGNSLTSPMDFSVTLSGYNAQVVTVAYTTLAGTATAGSDYLTTSGTLTFNPGITTQPISVPIVGDTVSEPTETFIVRLSSPTHATIFKSDGIGTILDNDLPTLSINDVSITEGNSLTSPMNFTVTLSGYNAQVVTVAYTTLAGTATAGSDYLTTSGTLTFNPGITTQPISVPIVGDLVNEPTETFTVVLSSPVNATFTKDTGIGTILDNDPLPTLSIDNQSILEGNSGTTLMSFTISLSRVSGQTITVAYTTVNGTALAPSDYVATSGILTFNPGVISQPINVSIVGDTVNEANEIFTVVLSSPSNATIAIGTGTGTIINDDGSPTLFINNKSITEGDSGTSLMNFTVILAGSTTQVVTVAYATVDGSATAPFDYSATSGTLTFTPPTSTQTISVPIVGDLVNEPTETFIVRLSSPTNASIADGDGVGTINDNDPPPTVAFSQNTYAVNENDPSGQAVIPVVLSMASDYSVSVNYSAIDGTAHQGINYQLTPGKLIFPPGTTSQLINVTILNDHQYNDPLNLTINLMSPANATLGNPSSATLAIWDQDALPMLSINSVSQNEGNGGMTNFNFTVSLSAASGKVATVNYSTYDGTAIAGSDYIATSGTLSFNAGVVTQIITVPVIGDYIKEPNDTFSVRLTAAVNAAIMVDTGIGTIIDDDLFRTMLPMLSNPGQPDLITSAFTLSPSGPSYHSTTRVTVTVQVKNAGSADTGPFWVDFYINPQPPPTGTNIPWNTACGMDPCYGIAWHVTNGLKAGQSITLTSTAGSYDSDYTIWPGMFSVGTSDLYVYVDSWGGPNGAVDEINESNNRGEIHGLKVTP